MTALINIADRMNEVSDHMGQLALDMECHPDCDDHWMEHAKQLRGASFMLDEWADAVRKEAGDVPK